MMTVITPFLSLLAPMLFMFLDPAIREISETQKRAQRKIIVVSAVGFVPSVILLGLLAQMGPEGTFWAGIMPIPLAIALLCYYRRICPPIPGALSTVCFILVLGTLFTCIVLLNVRGYYLQVYYAPRILAQSVPLSPAVPPPVDLTLPPTAPAAAELYASRTADCEKTRVRAINYAAEIRQITYDHRNKEYDISFHGRIAQSDIAIDSCGTIAKINTCFAVFMYLMYLCVVTGTAVMMRGPWGYGVLIAFVTAMYLISASSIVAGQQLQIKSALRQLQFDTDSAQKHRAIHLNAADRDYNRAVDRANKDYARSIAK
jgi:hypothetical protein